MTLAVASGVVSVAGAAASVTGGNVTITAAHASLPRFDLVVVDNTGAKSVVAGTPTANPIFPSASGKVVLAAVRIPAAVASINGTKIVDKRVTPFASQQLVPTGSLTQFVGGAAPAGWLLCDGSAVSRTTYAALYALTGDAYGAGNGTTTFNVPDLRGRMPVGLGTHADVDTLGDNDGMGTVATRRPKHAHSVTIKRASGSSPGNFISTQATDLASDITTGISVGQAGMTDTSGYLVVNYIVKT